MSSTILGNKSISIKLFSVYLFFQLIIGCQMSPDPAQNVKLNRLFTDNMVLQQKMEIPIWGTAQPGGEVVVNLDQVKGKEAVLERIVHGAKNLLKEF